MANQNGDSGANIALAEVETNFSQKQQGFKDGNVFDNPFDGISAQECVVFMRDILDNPEISLELKDIRITQLQNMNPQGLRLCYQESVLPHKT